MAMSFFQRISRAVIGKSRVDDDTLDAIEEALVESDMGVDTTLKVIDALEERVQKDKYMSFDELGVIVTAAKVRGSRLVRRHLIECVRKTAARFPGRPYNLVVCEGGVPEECDRLTEELKALLPDCKALLRGRLDATLAVHLGPHLLGAGIQFL